MLSYQPDHLDQMLGRLPGQYKGKPRIAAIVGAVAAEIQALEDALWAFYLGRLLQRGPIYIVARAQFFGTDTAQVSWPLTLASATYATLIGIPIVTDGGGGVTVNVDPASKTINGCTVNASAAFTGYVDVVAWQTGENPFNRGVGGDILTKLGNIAGQPRNGVFDDVQYFFYVSARIASDRSDGRRDTLIRIAKLLVPVSTIQVQEFQPAAMLIMPQSPVQVDSYVAASFLAAAKSAGVRLTFGWSTVPLSGRLITGYSTGIGIVPTAAQSPGWSSGVTGGALSGAVG